MFGRNMTSFFEHTSLHGLSYLGHSKDGLTRTFWAISIAASFIMGLLVSYWNVMSWNETPSAVKSVDIVDIQKHQIPPPSIVLCPTQPFLRSFVMAFFDDPDVLDDVQVQKAIVKHNLNLMQKELQEKTKWKRLTPIEIHIKDIRQRFTTTFDEKCTGFQESHEVTCSLWNSLWRIGDMIKSTEFVDQHPVINQVQKDLRNIIHRHICYSLYFQTPINLNSLNDDIKRIYPFLVTYENRFLNASSLTSVEFSQLYTEYFPFTNDLNTLKRATGSSSELVWIDMSKPIQEGTIITNLNSITKYGTFLLMYHCLDNSADDKFLDFINEAIHGYFEIQTNASFIHIFQSFDGKIGGNMKIDNPEVVNSIQKKRTKLTKYMSSFYPDFFNLAHPFSFCQASNQCPDLILTNLGVCYAIRNQNLTDGMVMVNVRDILDIHKDFPVAQEDDGAVIYDKQRSEFVIYSGSILSERFSPSNPQKYSVDFTSETFKEVSVPVNVAALKKTTETFRSMSVSRRRCFYPEEFKLKHHSLYSQKNCILECAWEKSSHYCHCIPWYLHKLYPAMEICSFNQMECFEEMMSKHDMNDETKCEFHCLPDCEETFYQQEPGIIKDLSEIKSYQEKFITSRYEEVLQNATLKSHEGRLADKMQNNAKVTSSPSSMLVIFKTFFANDMTNEIVLTAIATPVDMIANIGGTLGLFSGFSILSAVEIIFWVIKCMREKVVRKSRICPRK